MGAVTPAMGGLQGTASVIGAVAGGAIGFGVAVLPPVKAWFSARAADVRVADLAGAGESISGRGLDSLRVHRSDHDVSEFAPRDRLPEVRDLLAKRTPVLVEGQSMSGKTRLVVQTISEGWSTDTLWFPTDDTSISKMVASGQDPAPGTVVFLDDVDRFLSNSSLSLTLLEKWLAGDCVVVATMTSAKYAQWRDDAASKLPGWDVLNKFTRVHLATKPTPGELAAMRSTGYADLIPAAREFGLSALLGGAPLAREKFSEGFENRSWGWALVRAAADWRRVGLGPATTDQLQELAAEYPDRPVTAQDWQTAWAWAVKPFNHTVSLLRAVESEQWEVLDVIADDATWSLHFAVLHAMSAAGLSPAQMLTLAVRTYTEAGSKLSPKIESLLDQAIAYGDAGVKGKATLTLGAFLAEEGRSPDKTANLLGLALEQDPNNAIVLATYAMWRAKVHDHDQAEQMYQRALEADLNDAGILGNYADFLTDVRAKHDQAERMYQRALEADPNHTSTLGNYANFLTDVRAEHDQAERMYQRALEADPNHANNLGSYARLLLKLGKDDLGERLAVQALELATAPDELPLRAVCSFYLFMHIPNRRQMSGVELKALLASGTTTAGWSFAANLARLREDEDSRTELCTAVAEALATGDVTGLNRFPEWQANPSS